MVTRSDGDASRGDAKGSDRGWLIRALLWTVAYAAIARGVGNLYPFSTFEMYGGTQLGSASRIAVRTDDGVAEVERFTRWRCATPPDPDPRTCREAWPYFHIEAVDRTAVAWIAAAPPPQGTGRSAEVIRRVWRLVPTREIHDCVLAVCEVEP